LAAFVEQYRKMEDLNFQVVCRVSLVNCVKIFIAAPVHTKEALI
jgi:hypothetical protein